MFSRYGVERDVDGNWCVRDHIDRSTVAVYATYYPTSEKAAVRYARRLNVGEMAKEQRHGQSTTRPSR